MATTLPDRPAEEVRLELEVVEVGVVVVLDVLVRAEGDEAVVAVVGREVAVEGATLVERDVVGVAGEVVERVTG